MWSTICHCTIISRQFYLTCWKTTLQKSAHHYEICMVMQLWFKPQRNHITKASPETPKNQFGSHRVNQPTNGFTHAWVYCFQGQLSRLTAFTNYREKANKLSRDQSWLCAVHLDISTPYNFSQKCWGQQSQEKSKKYSARSVCSQLQWG